jgi:D-alanyl-D-alanine carboxypeptidase
MRNIPEEMWDIWEAGKFVGQDKPTARVTIQKAVLKKSEAGRTLVFNQDEPQYEIPNVLSVAIDNTLGADAAQMTLVLLNQTTLSVDTNLDLTHDGQTVGPTVRELRDLGKPGYYSYRRGITPSSAERWGHEVNPVWVDMFIPNRVIRTFQGYGTDGAGLPWLDTKLVLTGTWLIDSVEYRVDGKIQINCRSAAKLLIEQRLYPPIVPTDKYPLTFCYDRWESTTVENTQTQVNQTSTGEVIGANVAYHIPSGYDSSVTPWYGYNGSVYGHRASHVFDGDYTSYWLSVGNNGPNQVWSYEWIGAVCNGEPINRIQFRPKWGGYVCYVGVKVNGVWQGSAVVPYGADSGPAYPNGSNIKYIMKINVPKSEEWFAIELPQTYQAQEIRLVFTNLAYSGLGTYPYRAAVYDMNAYLYTPPSTSTSTSTVTTVEQVDTFIPGNIKDYTDIIKVLCAWSGFHWTSGPTDPTLAPWGIQAGRVWGDFFYSGAYPVDPPCIPESFWDNKSVMDAINQVKEILGFIFYVDHTGGVVWRMPNIWRTGNYVAGLGYVGYDSVRDIDENKVLIDFGVTIDDTNLRSEIVVVAAEDPTLFTAIAPGFAQGEVIPSAVDPRGDLALLGGQDRVMLVPNYPFASQAEVEKFAYLVSLWIHWSYRKGKVRIPGNPAFEPDDQVRIYERITSESYIHYIEGVSSAMDLVAGTWYMDLTTHWLGEGPDQAWVVNTYTDMPASLFAYLRAIGQISEDTDPGLIPPFVFEIPPPPSTDIWERVDDDYSGLFPGLPPIYYVPSDVSDEDLAATYPDGTYNDGGTVKAVVRGEKFYHTFWGAPGASNTTTIQFMAKWIYDTTPPQYVPLNTFDGQLVTTNTQIQSAAAGAFRLMSHIFAEHEYYVYSSGAYNYRNIAGTNTLSVHSWGLAIDINPNVNYVNAPYSSIPANFRAAAQEILGSIRTKTSNARVFEWGGNWSSKKDWMHFEVVCTRTQALEGFKRI